MDQIKFNIKMYTSLEKDFSLILDYIPIEGYKNNKHSKIWSPKFMYVVLNGCSEIETIIKQILDNPASNSISNILTIRRKIANEEVLKINEYRKELDKLYKLSKYNIAVVDIGIKIKPFGSFGKDKSPNWWLDHNALKHNRSGNYLKGNFENALYVLAGLYLLNWIHPDDVNNIIKNEESKIFKVT
jgi:hypothetical protein